MLTQLYTYDVRSPNKQPIFQSFEIKNCGFGPAVIKSLTFTFKDKPYEEIKTLIRENSQNLNYNYNLSSSGSLDTYIIGSNEQLTIFKLFFDYSPSDTEHIAKV